MVPPPILYSRYECGDPSASIVTTAFVFGGKKKKAVQPRAGRQLII